jgi:hypothetical protein
MEAVHNTQPNRQKRHIHMTEEAPISPVRAYLCSPNLEMRQNNYIHTRYKSFGLVRSRSFVSMFYKHSTLAWDVNQDITMASQQVQ